MWTLRTLSILSLIAIVAGCAHHHHHGDHTHDDGDHHHGNDHVDFHHRRLQFRGVGNGQGNANGKGNGQGNNGNGNGNNGNGNNGNGNGNNGNGNNGNGNNGNNGKAPFWAGVYETKEEFEHAGGRCSTRDTTPEEEQLFSQVVHAWVEQKKQNKEKGQQPGVRGLSSFSATVPTYLHVIKTSSGYSPMTAQKLADSMAVLNAAYAATGFSFVVQGTDYTYNTAWYDAPKGQDYTMRKNLRIGGHNALNIYLKDGVWHLGWASLAGPNIGPTDGVVIHDECVPGGSMYPYNLGDTLVHEVVRFLALFFSWVTSYLFSAILCFHSSNLIKMRCSHYFSCVWLHYRDIGSVCVTRFKMDAVLPGTMWPIHPPKRALRMVPQRPRYVCGWWSGSHL
jgi:hypothetical protein